MCVCACVFVCDILMYISQKSPIVTLHTKCTRALTFENLCTQAGSTRVGLPGPQGPRGGMGFTVTFFPKS